eukprot:CAMPEP_0177627862 /NCGR_PEP_ID=MMETSP0419_2-20121207/31436_1 /TAXON_ID=582737 /ORGANISM="Tetraselmis sp., Strain GSL018" /LENGTH=144 /DNA_ID=CAMNT_0019129057 /DNA_START=208 /DNA_END=640 /DNA_ORIENTATION=+
MPTIVVGVDGGGTKTVAVVIELLGEGNNQIRELGRSVKGSSNRTLKDAVSCVFFQARQLNPITAQLTPPFPAAAVSSARLDFQLLEVVSFCVAGLDTQADRRAFEDTMRNALAISADIVVNNDSVAALSSGTWGRCCGCVLVAG